MVNKIIHIADVHIPSDTKTRPYGEMLKSFFNDLYVNEIEGHDPETIRIVVVGDIFENKIRATNEARVVFHQFLNYCNLMCGHTYLVAGNHDMLDNNHDRVDSLAPTFEINGGGYENVTYLDKECDFQSGCLVDDNVVWNLFSRFSDFSPTNITHDQFPGKRIIGLFHGDVVGATTDVGHMCDRGVDMNIFSECDCVMAGHIHKYQTIKTNDIPLVYSSSLFQHDAGENVTGHGYVVWNLDDMSYRFVGVENKYRIFKYRMTSYDDVVNGTEELINL